MSPLVRHRRNPLRVPGQPWQPPNLPDKLIHSQSEGVITESIRGNQVRVTVSLRRTWAVLMGAGDEGEFRQSFALLARIWRWFDSAVKIAVCLLGLFIAYEIVSAFLPGGAFDRLIGGLQ